MAVLLTGCASPVQGLFPASPGQATRTIYVLHRGWHTGVIVRNADIPTGLWPEHQEYPGAEYLEVGWGDSEGYRFPWTTRVVCRAMFDSKASVLLIHAFSGSVPEEYSDIANEIIAVQVSRPGFARLCTYIQNAYALDPRSAPIPLPGMDFEEDYFLATGHYSMLNNCNNWTAGALRAGGCPIRPGWSLLPGIVMFQTCHFGRVIWQEDPARHVKECCGPTGKR